jgi:hypothetical protein
MTNTNGRKVIGGEIVDEGQSIESVANNEKDLKQMISEEAFAHEFVVVEIQSTGDENAAPNGVLTVNGRFQPWTRDVPIRMRRMFVEVLARCKETKFRPQDPDHSNPERTNTPIGRTAFAIPFSVIEDDNPKGRAWLAAIKAEPA